METLTKQIIMSAISVISYWLLYLERIQPGLIELPQKWQVFIDMEMGKPSCHISFIKHFKSKLLLWLQKSDL